MDNHESDLDNDLLIDLEIPEDDPRIAEDMAPKLASFPPAPNFDVPDVPDMTVRLAAYAEDAGANGSDVASDRPLGGETRAGEPTPEQIADELTNEPSRVYAFALPYLDPDKEDQIIPVVNLTKRGWIKFIMVFVPRIERMVRQFIPMVKGAMGMAGSLRHLGEAGRQKIWNAAKDNDPVQLQETLVHMGYENVDYKTLDAICSAAHGGRTLDFILQLLMVILAPLGGEVMTLIDGFSPSKLIVELADEADDMVMASVTASLKRHGIAFTEEELRERIEMMDGFDQFNVIYLQYAHYTTGTGALGRFLGQGAAMIPGMNIGTGTRKA